MSGTKRISALTELASTSVAGEDIVAVVDMSQASVADKTKHMQVSSLLGSAASDSKPKVSFKTVAAFVADNNSHIGYSGAKFNLAEGDVFEAGGYRYSVRATGASDNHIASAGGFKADVQKINNVWPMLAFNPNADGSTDDKTKIDFVNNSGDVVDLGGKSYEYGGVFTATATFINGQIVDDNRTRDYRVRTRESAYTAHQPRGRINYNTAAQLRIDGLPDEIAMGGFRIFGRYLTGKGRLISTGLGSASHTTVDITGAQLSALNTAEVDNWYGVFACANEEDSTASFRLVPFLRAYSVADSVVTLAHGGENQNATPATQTYDVDTDAFAGVDCLVIQQGGNFSGRITTISANSTTTVTLADVTGIAQLDFLLPAPPGFDEYHYLGAAYYETGPSWRNIADSGSIVNSRMSNVTELTSSGDLANVKFRFGGNISPLATGFIGSYNATLSTTSTGNFNEIISHDSSNHDIWRLGITKESTANATVNAMMMLAFSKEQAGWITTGGALEATAASRTILTYGWIEP